MQNPFKYGGVVGEGAFCNREQEQRDLFRAIENGDKLFVYSERRLGKTSLIRLVLDQLPPEQYIAVYVDLWPTDGTISFASVMAKAIAEATSTTADKLLETARTFFAGLVPSVTLDDQGKPQVSFGVKRAVDADVHLDEVLQAPARIAAREERKLVIVFDEFQQILEYESDHVERSLRSAVQMQGEIAYVFSGSRKHLIQRMFLDKSRPLYRAGGHYPLGMIDEAHWQPFIGERFADADKRITQAQIQKICQLTDGHPFYTQHLCHVIWERCDAGGKVTGVMLDTAVQVLLDRESYAYTALWESLSLNQRRFLKGLSGTRVGKPFASAFIQDNRLGSASNVQRVLDALLERDIIDRDNGSFVITDRFFRLWIQKMRAGEGDV